MLFGGLQRNIYVYICTYCPFLGITQMDLGGLGRNTSFVFGFTAPII
jgi:hypothetical protein